MPHLAVDLASVCSSPMPPTHLLNQACGFFTKRCFFLRSLFTLSSHCFQVYPHSQIITFAVPRASTVLLVSLFVLGYWLAALPSFQSVVLVHDLFLVIPHHDHSLRCLPTPARFFRRCLFFPHCSTFFPFTPRRASHFKPLNTYYSPSTSIHCKIYTPHCSYNTHASSSLTRS